MLADVLFSSNNTGFNFDLSITVKFIHFYETTGIDVLKWG